jgi:hypothetical protein
VQDPREVKGQTQSTIHEANVRSEPALLFSPRRVGDGLGLDLDGNAESFPGRYSQKAPMDQNLKNDRNVQGGEQELIKSTLMARADGLYNTYMN